MSAGQEIGSPIRENRTLLPAPLPPDEARGTLAAAAGVSPVGLRLLVWHELGAIFIIGLVYFTAAHR